MSWEKLTSAFPASTSPDWFSSGAASFLIESAAIVDAADLETLSFLEWKAAKQYDGIVKLQSRQDQIARVPEPQRWDSP